MKILSVPEYSSKLKTIELPKSRSMNANANPGAVMRARVHVLSLANERSVSKLCQPSATVCVRLAPVAA